MHNVHGIKVYHFSQNEVTKNMWCSLPAIFYSSPLDSLSYLCIYYEIICLLNVANFKGIQ